MQSNFYKIEQAKTKIRNQKCNGGKKSVFLSLSPNCIRISWKKYISDKEFVWASMCFALNLGSHAGRSFSLHYATQTGSAAGRVHRSSMRATVSRCEPNPGRWRPQRTDSAREPEQMDPWRAAPGFGTKLWHSLYDMKKNNNKLGLRVNTSWNESERMRQM